MLHQHTTLNCKGKLLDLSTPVVMGVLNVTPDSFYDGGKYIGEKEVLKQSEQMISEGASIIDIGGMSSRPGAEIISSEEELRRVIPAIEAISKHFPDTILSIDTVNSMVAKRAVGTGVSIINDISAGSLDEAMFETVAALDVSYILMHIQGVPETMQVNPVYKDLILDVLNFLIEKNRKTKKTRR